MPHSIPTQTQSVARLLCLTDRCLTGPEIATSSSASRNQTEKCALLHATLHVALNVALDATSDKRRPQKCTREPGNMDADHSGKVEQRIAHSQSSHGASNMSSATGILIWPLPRACKHLVVHVKPWPFIFVEKSTAIILAGGHAAAGKAGSDAPLWHVAAI
ncbi:hypothetical protein BCR44DRAFT_410687 [Catenaria anguillulae PL171]|uniref:Uncharacterized protein n=1 Tax=Catenaria anguillulae PL171 TaxID=765915 RepID=A0A1Y2I1Q7_9FUNG|nr:hypothetical protein BCR44DRAFT_410687 [Catenaria anguillulae PL171]